MKEICVFSRHLKLARVSQVLIKLGKMFHTGALHFQIHGRFVVHGFAFKYQYLEIDSACHGQPVKFL